MKLTTVALASVLALSSTLACAQGGGGSGGGSGGASAGSTAGTSGGTTADRGLLHHLEEHPGHEHHDRQHHRFGGQSASTRTTQVGPALRPVLPQTTIRLMGIIVGDRTTEDLAK